MNKHFDQFKLLNKLPKDDPECLYVNEMMEMTTELLRDMCNNAGESYDKLHGVVPKCKLPDGYYFGKSQTFSSNHSFFEQRDNKIPNTNSQNSSNSNSTVRMEVDEHAEEKKSMAIEIVSNDIRLSSDEDDEHDQEDSQIDNSYDLSDNARNDSEKFFETLNKCSSKIPKVNSPSLFKKHYGNSKLKDKALDNIQKSKKDPLDDASCTGDTEPFEDSNESAKAKPQDVMNFIKLLSSSKPEIKLSTFEPIYNEINRKRQAMKMKKENSIPAKITKYMVSSFGDSMVMQIKINADLAKEFNFKSAAEAMKKREMQKESKSCVPSVKPIYTEQESYSFTKSEISNKKEDKPTDLCSNLNTQQLFGDSSLVHDSNAIKKPQAAAKQIFPLVAVVKGNPNKASSSIHSSNSNIPPLLQLTHKSKQPAAKDQLNTDEQEADEQKVVNGLKAIEKLRYNTKTDFIRRLRDLNTEKWLRDADGHKEKANNEIGKLDYPPMIILALRKYLIYNYSLDVKEQSKKCHEEYIKNAAFVNQINKSLRDIYDHHTAQISDPNCPRLWNLKLIKWFSVTLCLKLSAILQYRAFRNVSNACRNAYNYLIGKGVLDKDGHTNTLVTETNQISPFDGFIGYSPGRNSTRNSSPRGNTPLNQRTNINAQAAHSGLSTEIKTTLQFYIEHTCIINNSYHDWYASEMNHAKFCEKSPRHEEAWRDLEWKIVEKTGGITLSGIDESMAFVIKYLDGFITYMNEFQKNLCPSRSSDSKMIS